MKLIILSLPKKGGVIQIKKEIDFYKLFVIIKNKHIMKDYKNLFLDETGKASYKHPSLFFILSGVIISEKFRQRLNNLIKKIKIKHFNNEEILLHGREIFRKKGPFASLNDPKKELSFWMELISVFNNSKINLSFIMSDKGKAKLENWQESTILKRSYLRILEIFAGKQLIDKEKGKIFVESCPSQDAYLIYAHNRLQCTGVKDGNISAKEYGEKITSLTLAKKTNQDVELEIADIFALIAEENNNPSFLAEGKKMSTVEKMRKRLFERKIKAKDSLTFLEIIT